MTPGPLCFLLAWDSQLPARPTSFLRGGYFQTSGNRGGGFVKPSDDQLHYCWEERAHSARNEASKEESNHCPCKSHVLPALQGSALDVGAANLGLQRGILLDRTEPQ